MECNTYIHTSIHIVASSLGQPGTRMYLAERDSSIELRPQNPQYIYHTLGDGVVNLCEGCGKGSEELDMVEMKVKYSVRCYNTMYCIVEC